MSFRQGGSQTTSSMGSSMSGWVGGKSSGSTGIISRCEENGTSTICAIRSLRDAMGLSSDLKKNNLTGELCCKRTHKWARRNP